jgi:hypothetical protein
MSGVFQTIDPPPHHRPASVYLPAFGAGVGHTRWVERGWGVNSLEDARHCSVLCICKYFVGNLIISACISMTSRTWDCSMKPTDCAPPPCNHLPLHLLLLSLYLLLKKGTVSRDGHFYRRQCSGSGSESGSRSTGSTCFWASRIRIRIH